VGAWRFEKGVCSKLCRGDERTRRRTTAEPAFTGAWDKRLGHKRLGHKRLGHKRLGHKRLGHKRLGHKRLGAAGPALPAPVTVAPRSGNPLRLLRHGGGVVTLPAERIAGN